MNLAEGKYLAQLEFMRGDKVILEKQFGFSIGNVNAGASGSSSKSLIWLIGLIVLVIIIFTANQFRKAKGLNRK